MINSTIISHSYAKAIFDIFIKQNDQNQWKSTLKLLSDISKNYLIRSLNFNSLPPQKLSNILICICENIKNHKINPLIRNIIYVITKNNRILYLPNILKDFNNLYYEHIQSVKIEITSARTLNKNQLKKIIKTIEYHLSKRIHIVNKIDPKILGGIIIRIKNTIIDGSIKGRILRLHNILQS